MRLFILTFFTLLSLTIATAQVVITEIMYNPPESGQDLTEFVELYNNGSSAVDMTGYSFISGFDYTFETFSLGAGEYVLVAVNSDVIQSGFGMASFQWTGGSLSNGGELIQLSDASGGLVDEVDYDDGNGWTNLADGAGSSLVLCDFDADNNDPTNWAAANTATGFSIGDREVYATPGASSDCATGPVVLFLDREEDVAEDGGSVSFRVAVSGADLATASQTITIMAMGASTASIPDDLSFTPSSITFSNGQATDTVSVTVTIVDDADAEGLENLILALVDPTSELTVQGVAGQAVLSISDNDSEVADIVINELMYNPPGSDAAFEYLELYNNGATAVDMAGYYFETGVEKVFSGVTIMPGGFLVVAVDSLAFEETYGVPALQWTNGGLGNGGESVELRDASGNIVDVVQYDDGGDWPTDPDGGGNALVLCDPSSDNSLAASWIAATQSFGIFISGTEIFGSPGSANDCTPADPTEYTVYPISIVTTTDVEGVVDSLGVKAELTGIVHGVNLHPNGLSFTVIDGENNGIAVFDGGDNYGYTVVEGDEVTIQGNVSQYNGLAQIGADSVWMNSAGNPLQDVLEVTALNEDTESQLVQLVGVTITNAATAGGGLNVTLTDGVNEYTMRADFDTDITEEFIDGLGTQVLNVTGLGGQFDSSSPFDDGYQLLPRYQTDIIVTDPGTPSEYEVYPISVVTTTDAEGVVDSLDVKAELTGVVHGVNLHPNGLLFTVIDSENNGIAVFDGGDNYGYTVTEGDEVTIQGNISQYNGLAQIAADSVWMNSAGNPLQDVLEVTALNEDTESQLVQLSGVTITNVATAGGGLNVTLTDGVNEYTMRADFDTDITEEFITSLGSQPLLITGLGGQFDNSSPFDGGYQLLPRYQTDIEVIVRVLEPVWASSIRLFPVPVNNKLTVELGVQVDEITVRNALGQVIIHENVNANQFDLDASNWTRGIYYLEMTSENERVTRKFIKQ